MWWLVRWFSPKEYFFSSVVLMVVFSGLDLARLFSQNRIYFPYWDSAKGPKFFEIIKVKKTICWLNESSFQLFFGYQDAQSYANGGNFFMFAFPSPCMIVPSLFWSYLSALLSLIIMFMLPVHFQHKVVNNK